MPISQSRLLIKAFDYVQSFYEGEGFLKTASRLKSAFLCHSHRDENIVKGLIVSFQEYGIHLYIDWKDHSMPDSPNRETELKIRNKIETCDVFLFLATVNSKSSRWCPWEIGYADSNKKNIYIIPTYDELNNYYGNEYLELYPRIDEGIEGTKEGLAMYKTGERTGAWLSASIL